MEDKRKKAIQKFFQAVKDLKSLDIIRSDTYLGDIGEYISKYFYDIELAKSNREPGYDGHDSEGRVQVKYHGSSIGTNINLGIPTEYDNVLIVLGPNSLLRSSDYKEDFLVYRINSEQVKTYTKAKNNSYSCGKRPFNGKPDNVLSLST